MIFSHFQLPLSRLREPKVNTEVGCISHLEANRPLPSWRFSARPGPRYAALHAARNARGSHGDWAHDAPHASAGRLLPPAPDVWHAALSTHAGRSLGCHFHSAENGILEGVPLIQSNSSRRKATPRLTFWGPSLTLFLRLHTECECNLWASTLHTHTHPKKHPAPVNVSIRPRFPKASLNDSKRHCLNRGVGDGGKKGAMVDVAMRFPQSLIGAIGKFLFAEVML